METIDKVHKLCMEIKQEIATIHQRCKDRERISDGHTKTLYGENGRGGVVAAVNALTKAENNRQQWTQKIIAPVIAGLIVAVIIGGITVWAVVTYGK